MYRIIDSRGSGKTSRLMLIAKENNAVFVCSNPYCMEQKAKAYGIDGIQFISFADFLDMNQWRGSNQNTPIVIDEIEILLKAENPYANLIGYSLTKDD